MPANLTPEYFEAEKKYRAARTIEEKIAALREMLAVMPKHKGTDKLQADIRAKISRLQKLLKEERKSGGKRRFLYPQREGAGQVAIVGPPNSGKSSLLASLTGAHPVIADYPFSTHEYVPGMMNFEDIQIQLIDLPPFVEGHLTFWQIDIVRNCDLVLLVADLASDSILEDLQSVINVLEERKISLIGSGARVDDIFGPVHKRTLLIANKMDAEGAQERLEVLREFFSQYPIIPVSASTGEGLEKLPNTIFRELEVIRVYTKEPGHPPDMKDPLILPAGATVIDAAEKIHKDFARKLKYARLWGSSKFGGQRVEKHYELKDKDIVEFHI